MTYKHVAYYTYSVFKNDKINKYIFINVVSHKKIST